MQQRRCWLQGKQVEATMFAKCCAPLKVTTYATNLHGVLRKDEPLCVLTVHAHPDDEASKGAPTMAMYGAQGVRTVLVCCTGGEEGDVANPALKEPGQPFHGLEGDAEKQLLAQLRPAELEQSAKVIGFHHVEMLGYRDSGMLDSPANQHPDCFHMADLDEAVGRLVRIIRRERPHVLITYNDDQRGYPHPDHVKVHDISIVAFDRAADSAWYPEAGEPWQPLKMYYSAWSRMRLTAIHEAMLRLRGASPFDESWFDRPDLDGRITTRLPIGNYLYARSGALRAHRTQIDENEPFWFGLSDAELAETYPYEDWILAKSLVATVPLDAGGYEDDMFRGVRESR
jgi:mycothiol S-conjugate amidase